MAIGGLEKDLILYFGRQVPRPPIEGVQPKFKHAGVLQVGHQRNHIRC